MHLVSSTKRCIQQYRDDKWEALLTNVKSFCNKRNIDVPDMNARYVERRGRARHQQADFTIEHHYEHNVVQHSSFKRLLNISEFCQWLVRTEKSTIYQLVFRVVVLLLTLPVSTVTTERAFSAINIVKTRLCNKIEDEFLTDSLML
jgi:hypothetical protein